MADDTDSIGTVSVDIVGNLEPFYQDLEEARSAANDEAPATERARGKRGKAGGSTPATAEVEAKVTTKLKNSVAKDVQTAIDKDMYQLTIDTGNIREQIANALKAPFDIIVNAEIRGGQAQEQVGLAHGSAVATGAPMSRGAPPEEITKLLAQGMRDAIDNVYRNVNDAFEAAGKGRFGKQEIGPGNHVEKAIELIDRFGGKFSDMLQVETNKAGIPSIKGGSMSGQELGKALGIDAKHPALQALQANAMGFTSSAANGASPSRGADTLFSLINKWARDNPVTAQPAAAAEPIAQALVTAMKQEGGGLSDPKATPALDQLNAAGKTLQGILKRLPFQSVEPIDYMTKYPVDRTGARAPRPDDDPEATARAGQQLGPGERANVRRLIGGFTPRSVDGIKVDLEPLLQAARAGEFANFFKTNDDELKRFVPGTDEEEARVRAARTNKRGFTVEGIKGQVTNVEPTDAFWDAVSKVYDESITAALRNDPEVKNLVSKSVRQGSATRPLVSPLPARAGQGGGEKGGIVSASATGFQSGYEASYRLLDTLNEIGDVSGEIEERWGRIADLQGSGRSTSRLEEAVHKREDRLAQLESRARDLAQRAVDIGDPKLVSMAAKAGVGIAGSASATPEQRRILDAAQKARDALEMERSGGRYRNASQRVVGEQVGLTDEDIAKRIRSSPTVQGRAQKEAGFDVAQRDMLHQILARFEGFNPDDPAGTSEERAARRRQPYARPDENSAQVLARAFREVIDPFVASLPEKGQVRRLGEKVVGDVGRTVFGEKDQVVTSDDSSARTVTERRGGLRLVANEEAERAAKLMDAGAGRGRVATVSRSTPTGLSSNSGGVAVEPDYVRPATSLDTERQEIEGKLQRQREARQAAELDARQRAQREAQRRFPGVRVAVHQGDESITGADSEKYKEFLARSTASRMGRIPAGEDYSGRLAEIKDIQKQADAALATVAGVGSGKGDKATTALQRNAISVMPISGDVRAEALDVLKARTAGSARSPYTRDTKDPATGDEMRQRYLEKGGMVAGVAGTAGAPRPKGVWQTEGIAGPSGTMHVIIAGQTGPVQVAWTGGGGGGRPPRGRVTAEGGDEQPPPGDETPPAGKEPKNIKFRRPIGVTTTAAERYDAEQRRLRLRRPIGVTTTAAERAEAAEAKRAAEIADLPFANAAIEQRQRERDAKTRVPPGPPPISIIKPVQRSTTTGQQRFAEAEAKRAAELAELPFKNAATEQRQQERAAAAAVAAAAAQQRRDEADARRLRRTARINNPVGFATAQDREDERQRTLRGQLRAINRRVPRRGFGASLTDLVTSLAPGSGSLERQLESADLATREATEISQASTKRAQTRTTRRGLAGQIRAERDAGQGGGEREVALISQYREQIASGKQLNTVIRESTKRFEQFHGEATKGTTVLKSFSAAAAGSVISTGIGAFTVGLGMAVAAPIIQGVGEGITAALGPVIERLSGFAGTTGRVQGEFATQFRASNDSRVGTLAATGIAARLSDQQLAAVGGPLGQRGTTAAGTQSLQQQFELFNATQAIGRQGQGGFDRSLFRSTGGIADIALPFKAFGVQDISIGGQASTAETLTNQLMNLTGLQDISAARGKPPGVLDAFLGEDFRARGLTDEGGANKELAENNAQLEFLNANLKDFRLITSEDQAALDKQALIFAQGGAQDLGGRLREKGVLAEGVGGAGDVGKFLQQFAAGPKLEPAQLLAQDARAIRAQIAVEDMQRELALRTTNPQTFAMAEAARPLAPAATGINLTGLSAKEQRAVNVELGQTQKLYDQINADVDVGLKAAKSFVTDTLGGGAGAEFATSLDKVATIGKEISGIEIGLQTKQAAFSAAQYSLQISLANRSLKDAKGLTGEITKQNGDNLGIIERQSFLLQRQSQSLGMGMSQREINFQRAVAGFQSPGVTSEEREARMEEAKLEADYAQKQLDIQKKLFGLGGQQFKMAGTRQVRDLGRQLDLLERGRVLTVETAVAEKRIIALTKIQAKENKAVETFYNAAITRTGDVQAQIGKLVAATGEGIRDVADMVLDAFESSYRSFIDIVGGGSGNDQYSVPGSPGNGNAQGFLGTVNGATSLGKWGVAGEAAGEAVAILKNPQQLVSPMGDSGGDTFIVQIYNPVVKSDDDKRKLITDVKRAIQQEAAMLLPRRA